MSETYGDEVWANSVDRLHRSRLFAGAPRELVEASAPSFALRRVAAGTAIVLDSEAERGVHVIRRGAVRLELRGSRGAVLVVARLRAGDVFGVEALLGERPHGTFAICTQQTMLLSASAATLAPAFRSCAQIPTNVAGILVEQLSGIATALHGLRYTSLAMRVYDVLERVARDYAVAVADGTLLDVALDAEDVAALARCSPDDAADALFFLERNGRIRMNGSLITLLARG